MNKGYILHFDLQERGVNPLNPHMIFNELDNNTSDFFIVVTSGGKEVDMENADVTLAIIKPSGEAESQSIEIKDNCIYGNLKSYMKNEVGNYVASILLILDDQKVIIDEITYTITEDNVFRLLNDTVKEDERFPILTNMLNELYDIKIKEKQRELNEEQRIENENNRQNIFESKVNEVNSKINEVNKSKNEIVNTFNTLTAQQQQDAEVIAARDGEVSLKARLDRDLEKGKETFIDVEGSYITTDSNEGYLRNIEILGNTIQDSTNLADIRSVGDKVEGQELYKIPVVSCGKNLNNTTIKRGNINTDTGLEVSGGNTILCTSDFIQAKPLTKYVVSSNLNISSLLLTCYNKNKDYLGFCNIYNGYFETKENTKYIKFRFKKYNNEEFTDLEVSNINVQFEEGTIATKYEPYQEYKLEILSPVQLEKVGSISDRIIYKDGVCGIEKNIVEKTITGTENWVINHVMTNCIGFCCVMNLCKGGIIPITDTLKQNSSYLVDEKGVFTANVDNKIYVTLPKNELDNLNEFGCKNWFKEHPTKYIYVTTQPQFIELPNSQQVKLKSFANKTNISFLTEVEGTLKAQIPKSIAASINTHSVQIDSLNKELDRVKNLEESKVSTVETESNFTTVEETTNGYFEDIKLEGKTLVVNSNNEKVEPGTNGATLKSVGQDVDEIVIESINSNLFDENSLNKYIIRSDEDSFTLNYETMYTDGFIYPINGDYQYTFRYICKETTGGKNPRFIFIYDDGSDENTHVTTQNDFATYKHTSNPNKKLKCIKVTYTDMHGNWVIKKNSIMLNKGIESKPYVPYKSDKKTLLYYNTENQTWEKPILREWDSIEKHSDGKYYYHKRSREIILNGSENWILSDDTLTNTIRFIVGSYLPGQAKVNAMFLCDTLSFDKAWYDKDVEGYTITNSSGHIYIRINRSRLSTQDVAGFKAWLQANPTTLLYQLEEEKIYECTNIDLLTYENETNYVVESGAITPKTTLKVHNNISNIVRLLQKKVSILEDDITDYIITQNRLLLSNRYSTDNVGFTVDTATFSLDDSVPQYDNDLYNLILNNILVGKDNYNRDYMESLINFYWMTFVISDEMYFTLSSIIEEQYTEQENMPIEESPTE